MSTCYYEQLDGFHNVVFTCKANYAGKWKERIDSFVWKIECDEFVFKSPQYTNWHDQVWQRAKTMYAKEVKRVIQP